VGEIQIGTKHYNPEKSDLICKTPDGILYQKRGRGKEFYLYNEKGKTNKEKVTPVSWSEANNLTKTYGTREQHLEMFTLYKSKEGSKTGATLRLDEYHRIKMIRNADRLGLTMTEYIYRLIDRDDNNRNY